METLAPFLMPLLGGVLIGLASALMMLANGRIAGISGIFRGVLFPTRGDVSWRAWFLGGLLGGGALMALWMPSVFPTTTGSSPTILIAAGLLVGFGVRLGSGCTSGHGVCGIGRLSPRSLIATLSFIATGAITVFLMRHVLGG